MSCGCRSPVIASRSSCRAVADHIRNVNDGKLRVPVENGGVITFNFYPAYIDEEASRKTKAYFYKWQVAFEAMKGELGEDSIALGQAPRAQHAARYGKRGTVTAPDGGQLALGHSAEAVCEVLGENLLLVMKKVESIARKVKP